MRRIEFDENDRPKFPPELRERIMQIGRDCVLAGLTAEETVEMVNREVRPLGGEYRIRRAAT